MSPIRTVGTHILEDVLERILDRGMVLDGLSHLVAVAGSLKISARASADSVLSRHPFPSPALVDFVHLPVHVERATLPVARASTSPVRATRLIHGDFYADILPDRKNPGRLWLYVVQRRGSSEVLAMGSSPTDTDAEADALETIRDLRRAAVAATTA